MTRTITFQPSEQMNAFIAELVSSGHYNNQSEVIRAGLRLLEEQTASSNLEQLKNLKRLVQEGEDSPDVENFSMANLKKRLDRK